MKIVASVGNGTFLAEIDYREIDFLAGKTVGDSSGYYASDRKIPTGTKFDIVRAFDQIHRNNQRKQEIVMVRKTLEGIINSLDIIDPFIEEPKVEETPAEG